MALIWVKTDPRPADTVAAVAGRLDTTARQHIHVSHPANQQPGSTYTFPIKLEEKEERTCVPTSMTAPPPTVSILLDK